MVIASLYLLVINLWRDIEGVRTDRDFPKESGGFGDHVPPFYSPEGTPGEWIEDPPGLSGQFYVGPGTSNLPYKHGPVFLTSGTI